MWFRRKPAMTATEQLEQQWQQQHDDSLAAQTACGEPGCCEAGACTAQPPQELQTAFQQGREQGARETFAAMFRTIIVAGAKDKAAFHEAWGDLLAKYEIECVTPNEARAMNMSLFLKYGSELPEEAKTA